MTTPAKLVFISDWDDTILLTSSLTIFAYQQQTTIADMEISPALREVLSKMEIAAIAFLRKLKSLGTPYIVTSAEGGWVQYSCMKFLPNLLPLINGPDAIPVISACEVYKHVYGNLAEDGAAWKYLAMCRILHLEHKYPVYLCSIGDSMDEKTAAMRIRDEIGKPDLPYVSPIEVRTIKFYDNPTASGLVNQHMKINRTLAHIIYESSFEDTTFLPEFGHVHHPKKTNANDLNKTIRI